MSLTLRQSFSSTSCRIGLLFASGRNLAFAYWAEYRILPKPIRIGLPTGDNQITLQKRHCIWPDERKAILTMFPTASRTILFCRNSNEQNRLLEYFWEKAISFSESTCGFARVNFLIFLISFLTAISMKNG